MKQEVAESITKHFISIVEANTQLGKDLVGHTSESESLVFGRMVGAVYAELHDLTKVAWQEYPDLKPKELR